MRSPGFSESEWERLSRCLEKLTAHLRQSDVAITGGVGINLGLVERDLAASRRSVADLDLVATSLDAVAPGVSDALLVAHYHVGQPGVPKFMVQLVDPDSRIRVDVFPDLVGSVSRASMVQTGTWSMKVLALDDIFEHKVRTISKASRRDPVDPKHAADAAILGRLLGRPVPAINPGHFAKDVYGTDADALCERCRLSLDPGFPLAPKEEIFRLLGW